MLTNKNKSALINLDMKRIYSALLILPLLFVFAAVPAYAQYELNLVPPGRDLANLGINEVLSFVINAAFFVAAILALLYLIWGGINWITSGGDQEGVDAARKKIIAAIIGLIIVLLSYFILNFVLQLLGLGGINNLQLPELGGDTSVTTN